MINVAEGFANKEITDFVLYFFKLSDVFTRSFKKNMGNLLKHNYYLCAEGLIILFYSF